MLLRLKSNYFLNYSNPEKMTFTSIFNSQFKNFFKQELKSEWWLGLIAIILGLFFGQFYSTIGIFSPILTKGLADFKVYNQFYFYSLIASQFLFIYLSSNKFFDKSYQVFYFSLPLPAISKVIKDVLFIAILIPFVHLIFIELYFERIEKINVFSKILTRPAFLSLDKYLVILKATALTLPFIPLFRMMPRFLIFILLGLYFASLVFKTFAPLFKILTRRIVPDNSYIGYLELPFDYVSPALLVLIFTAGILMNFYFIKERQIKG